MKRLGMWMKSGRRSGEGGVLARMIFASEWISQRLEMGCAYHISGFIREVDGAETGDLFALKKALK